MTGSHLRAMPRSGIRAWHIRCQGSPHTAPCESVHPIHPDGEDDMQLVNTVKSFVRNEEGQDLLEYALLVALIALVAIAAVTAAGGSVSTIFQAIADKL